jgi:hypothetical protein
MNMQFTKADVARARSIVKQATAATFGRVEGNPNMWASSFPTYGHHAIAGGPKAAPSFLGSMGRFGKGVGNGLLTGAAGVFTGTGGHNSAWENVGGAALQSLWNPMRGKPMNFWSNVGHATRESAGNIVDSAMANGTTEQLSAPKQWWDKPGPMDAYGQIASNMRRSITGGGPAQWNIRW